MTMKTGSVYLPPYEAGGPDHAGIVPQLSDCYRGKIIDELPALSVHVIENSIDQEGACSAHASTKYNPGGVEGVLDRDAGNGEMQAGLVPNTETEFIAGVCTPGHIFSINALPFVDSLR